MDLSKYSEIQNIAKLVLKDLVPEISYDSTEASIAKTAKEYLLKYGVNETWYHNVPALVLSGSRSCLSISGNNYFPANEKIGNKNLVTVDLSPCVENIWGDCARSFVIENGEVTSNPESEEFIEGINAEKYLHSEMKKYVNTKTTFSELYQFGNQLIVKMGWENLDFLNNLGHSIETQLDYRRYIEKGCEVCLGSVSFFTFEPHIRKKGNIWGFKHENIYYFNENSELKEL